MTDRTVSACRVCGDADLRMVLSLGDQPPANAFTADPDEHVETHPLELVLCPSCALVQLSVSLDPDSLFLDYPYFSGYSPTVGESAAQLVRRTLAERALTGSNLVMEVASNDGYLLKHYRGAGVPVLGIDPARNIAAVAEAAGVPTIARYFTFELACQLAADGRRADVLHANNVLAHVPDVNDFVAGIAAVLAPGGVAIIETPSLVELVDRLLYDTVYHEHVYYYSATAVQRLLARHGLVVTEIEQIPIHGGSLRITAARRGTDPAPSVAEVLGAEAAAGVDTLAFFESFGRRVDRLRGRQRAFIDRARADGSTVAGYGAAAKATVLLRAIGATSADIDFVVDQSPHKLGLYLPNSGIPVLPVHALVERRPDFAVLFAWNYAEEVLAQRADYLAAGGRFVIPVPDVRVVGSAG